MPDFPDRIPLIASDSYAVSFNDILKKGTAHTGNRQGDMHFDSEAHDPVAAEYRKMRDDVIHTARSDHALATAENQEAYEKRLTTIMTERFEKSPLFKSENYTRESNATRAARNINELSPGSEYDCEAMGYIKGSILQETDRDLVEQGIRKEVTKFYYLEGALSNNPKQRLDGHAYVISEKTGNIIESAPTEWNQIYQKSPLSFAEHIGGFPAVTDVGIAYNGSSIFVDQDAAKSRTASLMCAPEDMQALENKRGNAHHETEQLFATQDGKPFNYTAYPAVAAARAHGANADPNILAALEAARKVDCSWVKGLSKDTPQAASTADLGQMAPAASQNSAPTTSEPYTAR